MVLSTFGATFCLFFDRGSTMCEKLFGEGLEAMTTEAAVCSFVDTARFFGAAGVSASPSRQLGWWIGRSIDVQP